MKDAVKFSVVGYPIRVIPVQNIQTGNPAKKPSHIHGYRSTVNSDAEFTTSVEMSLKLSPLGQVLLISMPKTGQE